jgi:predicted nuclease of predicted toxin-antitoxin system
VDRSLGKYEVAGALRSAGANVEVHDDHFDQAAKDEEWLQHAGENGWIVLTKDSKIRYREPEIAAILHYKVRAFVLSARNVSGEQMAETFRGCLNSMLKFVDKYGGPFVAKVTRSGTIEIIRK